jgi:hypothetical protein
MLGDVMQINLERVDSTLIDRVCQPVVDWIDHHMEVDCFRVARLCFDLSALAWILSQAGGAALAVRTGVPGLQVFQFVLIVLGLGAIIMLRAVFERPGGAGGGGKGGRPNPLRAAMYTHRLACLLWLAALLVRTAAGAAEFGSLALLAVGGFATAAVYLGACSNRPPKWRERRADNGNRCLAPVRRG